MNHHPHLIGLFELYSNETQSFRKVHRMIDLFESIIKSHTVVILSEYVQYNKLSSSAKGLLAQGLRTPSLGTWQLFSRVLFEELQKVEHAWVFSDFPSEFIALDKALNSEKTNIIAMRNAYAHGATPSDEQCDADVKKFESFLLKLMGLNWLVGSSISVEDGKVHLIASAGGKLSLHPLLLHRNEDCDASFAFFNDLKNDKVGLLNYPLGKHYKEREFYSEFLEILPLNDWKSSGKNEFQQRIDELTETFKGRTLERGKLLQFVLDKNKGYLSIQGNPGIGKSALIAQFFKDLKHHEISKSLRTVEYFIRRGTQQAQVEFMLAYMIRRTDEYFPAGKEIRAEGKTTYDVQSQLFAKWRMWSEQNKGQKLLFLIDGLDEGAENIVLAYLPRENFENILFIYGSRPSGHKSIDDLWATLPTEHHTKLELQGLGKEDIRALIYEVANKYEIERESPWIDAVQNKSQGNPLYLKLLCDSIEHGGVAVNDVHALPDKIDEYYKAILNRYAQDAIDGDALLFSLFTFAAAQDYLTNAHVGQINNLGPAATQRVCTTLKEVLYENPLTEEVLDYQLFHESFREYLIREYPKEVQDVAYRIIDFCSRWTEFEGSWEQRYALEHYAFHLSSSGKSQHHETLLNLITDQPFTATQKKVFKNFEASKRLFQLAMKKSIELQKEDHVLESALQLVDLKYEESNDAPQVVALASSGIPGDIELALKRIEQFGGADEDGVQRKFTLYMLCLMELTLLEGRNNPNRKAQIEKLLTHFDERLPTDHSILSWRNFFSSYLVFFMACEWAEIGLDYMVVYRRTSSFSVDDILDKGPYANSRILVLLEIILGISSDYEKQRALSTISVELAKHGQPEEALVTARGISEESLKSNALSTISGELAKQGELQASSSVMQEALKSARGISWPEGQMINALTTISGEFAKQGQLEAAVLAIQEALEIARGISDESKKSKALSTISVELAKQGNLEEALVTARGISDDFSKSDALSIISGEFAKQGQLETVASVMQDALETALGISGDEWNKSRALSTISVELAKHGQPEEALETARGISEESLKSNALSTISGELAKQGQLEASSSVMQEGLATARGIRNVGRRNRVLSIISVELAKQGQLEEAVETARDISEESLKIEVLSTIYVELAEQGHLEVSGSAILEALEIARGISDEREKSLTLLTICGELAKQGQLEASASAILEALETARGISDEWEMSQALTTISVELVKHGQLDEALETVRGISYESQKSNALSTISAELAKRGHLKASGSAMQKVLETTRGISDDWEMSLALATISVELAKHGQLEDALEISRGISYERPKIEVLSTISVELTKQGQLEASVSAMQEALEIACGISDESEKSKALTTISVELVKQGQLEKALETVRGISDEVDLSHTLLTISGKLAKLGRLEEALETARGISYKAPLSLALSTISAELAKQGQYEAAASAMQEALEAARGIPHLLSRIEELSTICGELAKQGQLEASASAILEALETARGISDEWKMSLALTTISVELAKQGQLVASENTGREISQIAERQSLWKKIAEAYSEKYDWQDGLQAVHNLQSDEAHLFYLKGWTDNLNVIDVKSETLSQSLPLLVNDTESIEGLLQKYAQHQMFFGNPTPAVQSRLNRSLNIQWLLDICQRFSKEQIPEKSSSNLNSWIDEFSDPDDRDDIRTWADKVSKGNMTEEKFQMKLKSIS